MIEWIIGGAIVGLFLTAVFWDDIVEKVAAWLREHNLEKSHLMRAWVRLDNFVSSVRRKIFVKKRYGGTVTVSEEVVDKDEVDDPDVLEELRKRGHYEQDILDMIA